jgi:hypothetical protein
MPENTFKLRNEIKRSILSEIFQHKVLISYLMVDLYTYESTISETLKLFKNIDIENADLIVKYNECINYYNEKLTIKTDPTMLKLKNDSDNGVYTGLIDSLVEILKTYPHIDFKLDSALNNINLKDVDLNEEKQVLILTKEYLSYVLNYSDACIQYLSFLNDFKSYVKK